MSQAVSLKEIESALSGQTERRAHSEKFNRRYFSSGQTFENPQMMLDLCAAEELVLRLYRAYKNHLYMFANVRVETHAPQYIYMPGYEHKIINPNAVIPTLSPIKKGKVFERGDEDHIRWLFFATLTDRRQKSGGPFGVYASHCKIFKDRPECYTKKATRFDPVEFGQYLRRFKIGVPNQSATYWIKCAQTLFGDYGGDPVRMFSEIGSDVRAVQAFKRSGPIIINANGKKCVDDPLPGYGPKITSLYSLFLHQVGVVLMPEDAFPVDVQVQRIFIQTGVIKKKLSISNAMMEKVLRPLICLLAKFHELDKVIVSHSFWLLGSEGCTDCPNKPVMRYTCPLYELCLGCENTASYFARGKWAIEDTPMSKGGSQVITFGMPGVVPQRYTRKKRDGSPQRHLFEA